MDERTHRIFNLRQTAKICLICVIRVPLPFIKKDAYRTEVQVCDATKFNCNTSAGFIKKILS